MDRAYPGLLKSTSILPTARVFHQGRAWDLVNVWAAIMSNYKSLKPYLPWRILEHPVDWQRRFGRRAPLELDIGFGNGERLVRRARAHPERNLVGIDISWPSASRVLRKLAVQKVSNVLILQAHAGAALQILFAPRSLTRAEALFPCPWPGDDQIHRRLFSASFWRLMNSRLVPGGVFTLVSDHREFFDWACQQAQDTGFDLKAGPRQRPLGTKYERKWRGQGQQTFFELQLTKTRHQPVPAWEDCVLQYPRLAQFEPQDFPLGAYPGQEMVAFREIIHDSVARRALLRTVVKEEYLLQDFWLDFSWQGTNWSLRLAHGCQVIPTQGVKRAVALAFELAGGGS